MNFKFIKKQFGIVFYISFDLIVLTTYANSNNIKPNPMDSEIRKIRSIKEAKEILDQASPDALIVFDIGETLTIQKNNLLRIIRNYRIFDHQDVRLMNIVLTKFLKNDPNAKNTILSNMLMNSPLYLVESDMKPIILNLQKKQIKMIAHCSSKARDFGNFKNFKEWRYSILKELGIDFSTSFNQNEIFCNSFKDKEGLSPCFYKGILFGSPKGKSLLALLDEIKFTPSEVICFDDCEPFIRSYARACKNRKINFKGFIYQAAIRQTPKLDTKIVDVQVKYMKRRKYIDDLKAAKIIRRQNKI